MLRVTHKMTYPDEFLKGVPNDDKLDSDNIPTSDLFYFKESDNAPKRPDSKLEGSISWRDDLGADEILFNLKKDGTIQFQAGIAILCRRELDKVIQRPHVNDKLSYERDQKPENKYHGNLLLKSGTEKRIMKRIAATIATLCFKTFIKNPYI